MSTAPTKQALTVAEFCTIYSVSKSLFYELVKAGAIKPVKIGRKTVIPREEAEKWFASLPAAGEVK